jgi:hypothetical protein
LAQVKTDDKKDQDFEQQHIFTSMCDGVKLIYQVKIIDKEKIINRSASI